MVLKLEVQSVTVPHKPRNCCNYHYSWNNRGISLEKLQKYEEALKCYEKAISIKHRFKLAINNRNNLLKQLGRLN
ncbi:tetratricopeptide repeat protein [Okeanomitos corallinicola TIOX110]|uniref:Tetratricopeptide repeat protein n=1 Tax=Okeanomitos corallinicola TIOX110 TaxID=3133117 RepID=A0ABZ2UWD4_9CYAN